MFGKKENLMVQVSTFHCGVCGTDCVDQYSFERHVGWAHPGNETSKAEKKKGLTGSEKKA